MKVIIALFVFSSNALYAGNFKTCDCIYTNGGMAQFFRVIMKVESDSYLVRDCTSNVADCDKVGPGRERRENIAKFDKEYSANDVKTCPTYFLKWIKETNYSCK